jgi:hypothetical protein
MTRYFFDVAAPTGVHYDYSGRFLRSLDEARELAELIVMDVGCSADLPRGTEVQVRDQAGLKLFWLPVLPAEVMAA